MDAGLRAPGVRLGRGDGFTLTELVVTIAILGALALVSAPRFFGTREFDDRFFFDDTWNALRHAQKLAVATGCDVQVTIAAGAYALHQQPGCSGASYTLEVHHPGTGASGYSRSAPGGISLGSDVSPFIFDGLGRARDTSGTVTDVSLTVGSRSLQIAGETGFVYTP
jgi:MSHA pilin protein MshC